MQKKLFKLFFFISLLIGCALHGFSQAERLINKKITIEQLLTETSKKASIDAMISGTATLASHVVEKYLHVGKRSKIALAMGSYVLMKDAYCAWTKSSETKIPEQFNFDMVPGFSSFDFA